MPLVNVPTGGGGDFLPIVKYDARAGRLFRVDREDGVSTPVDVTNKFKAVFDFENVEVGYINFATGSAPDFQMVKYGQPIPPAPSPNHKNGIRMTIKLGKDCGGDLREMAGTSASFLRGINKLFDAYESQKQPGKLPVVALTTTVPVTSGSGAKQSTNYEPQFDIVAWVDRPADMTGDTTRAAEAFGALHAPPSTGSTHAEPPARQSPALAAEISEMAEDFG